MKKLMLIVGLLAAVNVSAKPKTDWFTEHANSPITERLIKEAVKHTEVCKYYTVTSGGVFVIRRTVFPTVPFLISKGLPLTDISVKCKKNPFVPEKTTRWQRDDPRWEKWYVYDVSARLACKAILARNKGEETADEVIHQCRRYFSNKTK